VENVVVNRIAGTKDAIGKDMRMWVAALAGDGVDSLDVLRAKVVEHLAD
jgi:hypothetical protein